MALTWGAFLLGSSSAGSDAVDGVQQRQLLQTVEAQSKQIKGLRSQLEVLVLRIPEPYTYGADADTDSLLLSTCFWAGWACSTHGLQPVTLGTAAVLAGLQGWTGGHALLLVALNPALVLEHGQWHRLLSGPLLHVNMRHLAGNAGGLLWNGTYLESRLGAGGMLGALLFIGAAAQALELAISSAGHRQGLPTNFHGHVVTGYTSFATGFSGVAFGLLAAADQMRATESSSRVLSMYYHFRPWYHLLVNDSFARNVNQLAHLGGLLSGLAFWHVPRLVRAAQHHLRRASARRAAAAALPAPLPAPAEGNTAIVPSDAGAATGQQQATLQLLPKEEEKEEQSLWWELAVVCGHLLVGGLVVFVGARRRALI